MIRFFLVSSLLLSCFFSFGFSQTNPRKPHPPVPGSSLEGFLFPGLIYNHIGLGYSYTTTGGWEYATALAFNASPVSTGQFNLNLTFNANRYFKYHSAYIPIWLRASNTLRNVGFEEGYFPHTLRFALGTGIGCLASLNPHWNFRVEFGLGAALNLTSGRGRNWPFTFRYGDYGFESWGAVVTNPLIPAFRLKFSFLRKFRSQG